MTAIYKTAVVQDAAPKHGVSQNKTKWLSDYMVNLETHHRSTEENADSAVSSTVRDQNGAWPSVWLPTVLEA